MNDASRNDKTLLGLKVDRSIFKVDHEVALQDKEKLIILIVLVPMVIALHYPQAHHRVIHFAKRLVVPGIGAGFHQ